ncbi:MAG: protein kinase, partial [Gammaproteobacteria bacterium]|nr:protein kinase [Gammaproteobacteria bacterium]
MALKHKKSSEKPLVVESFNFLPGRVLAKKYEVVRRLGGGWEGEVYLVRERLTHIERAAKFFFPQRNPNNRAFTFYARKLHKLRDCAIVIQYYAQDTIIFRGVPVTFLVSDYIEGELLSDFIKRQKGKRIPPFQAVHLLYALVSGIEAIHRMREYHGDLHTENIIVRKFGLGFEVKLLDLYYWQSPWYENVRDDVCDIVRIFYDVLGGQKPYA